MRDGETREEKFIRLAKQRGNKILSDLKLLGNLSNRNNYQYNEQQIGHLFKEIEAELKTQKSKFYQSKHREIEL